MPDKYLFAKPHALGASNDLIAANLRMARKRWGALAPYCIQNLKTYSLEFRLSIVAGDLILLGNGWYITHQGLLSLARRKRCAGIHVKPAGPLCDPLLRRWAFEATVFRSRTCRGFIGYGDADPSNVSPLVHGAEMRVAETRAVNRALRKAYGIGICSVEEIGSFAEPSPSSREANKLPPQTVNGKNGNNGNHGGPKVRDRLCHLIRQHQLDANLVKSYAVDFCGTKTLREATREQVEGFVAHLADWAENDRNALLCQLNSYPRNKEGAA